MSPDLGPLLEAPRPVQGDVGDDQHPLAADRQLVDVLDHDGAVETAEDLVGHQRVVVGVV